MEDKVTKSALGRWLAAERMDSVLLTDYPLEYQG